MSVPVPEPNVKPKKLCPHGSPTVSCNRCKPEDWLDDAALIISELVKTGNDHMAVRGHSGECIGGSHCHCGYYSDYGEAYGKWSWATDSASKWIERFNKQRGGH